MHSQRQAAQLVGVCIFIVITAAAIFYTWPFISQAPARIGNILLALILGCALASFIAALSVRLGLHLAKAVALSAGAVAAIAATIITVGIVAAAIPIPTRAVELPMPGPGSLSPGFDVKASVFLALGFVLLSGLTAYVVAKFAGVGEGAA